MSPSVRNTRVGSRQAPAAAPGLRPDRRPSSAIAGFLRGDRCRSAAALPFASAPFVLPALLIVPRFPSPALPGSGSGVAPARSGGASQPADRTVRPAPPAIVRFVLCRGRPTLTSPAPNCKARARDRAGLSSRTSCGGRLATVDDTEPAPQPARLRNVPRVREERPERRPPARRRPEEAHGDRDDQPRQPGPVALRDASPAPRCPPAPSTM